MNDLERDLRYLGVLDKAAEICRELDSGAAVRYIRSSYHLLSKVYHPDLHRHNTTAATEAQSRLNLVKARLDAVQDAELARFVTQCATPRQAHQRVLVVEDEDGLKENLAEILSLEGYLVATAPNGVRGLKEHLSFRPHLVITDVVMPIMDGVEMVRQLRKSDPQVKVIFISGFFGTRAVQNKLLEEIERFGYPRLAKPFRPSQVLDLARQALT